MTTEQKNEKKMQDVFYKYYKANSGIIGKQDRMIFFYIDNEDIVDFPELTNHYDEVIGMDIGTKKLSIFKTIEDAKENKDRIDL